ncbi:hypothetical protein MTO96_050295, partial [Rhipicephalus appendiculatus]
WFEFVSKGWCRCNLESPQRTASEKEDRPFGPGRSTGTPCTLRDLDKAPKERRGLQYLEKQLSHPVKMSGKPLPFLSGYRILLTVATVTYGGKLS